MKRIALLAALACATAQAEEYYPEQLLFNFDNRWGEAKVNIIPPKGDPEEYTFWARYDPYAGVTYDGFDELRAKYANNLAMKVALEALERSLADETMIWSLAANVAMILSSHSVQIEDLQGQKTATTVKNVPDIINNEIHQYFGPGSAVAADEKSLHKAEPKKGGIMEINGWGGIDNAKAYFLVKSGNSVQQAINQYDQSIERTFAQSQGSKHYFNVGLAGWGAPRSGSHFCEPTLADMLTNTASRAGHYVLTRYERAGDSPVLHYTDVGELIPSATRGGNAFAFYGTESETPATIGPADAAVTNKIYFSAMQGTNLKVETSGGDGSVTISIGVYYR